METIAAKKCFKHVTIFSQVTSCSKIRYGKN